MTEHRWLVTLILGTALILAALTANTYASLSAGHTEHRRQLDRLERQVKWLERRSRDDRYLACITADSVGVDGLPQPCLDGHGRPLRSR